MKNAYSLCGLTRHLECPGPGLLKRPEYKALLAGLLLFPTVLPAANLVIRQVTGVTQPNYRISGHLEDSDLDEIPSRTWDLSISYVYRSFEKDYDVVGSTGLGGCCPADKKSTLETINTLLSNGVALSQVQAISVPNKSRYGVRITCKICGRPGYSWDTAYHLVVPPSSQNSPICNVMVPSVVNFGSVQMKETLRKSLDGRIVCDKAATVKVQLTNPQDKTAPAGVMRISDATVQYDVDGSPDSKSYRVGKDQAGAALFTLNFNLIDTGSTAGEKSGSLVLLADVP